MGWHVASDYEWNKLITYFGGLLVAGGKLKESGTIHWLSPNKGATNESGFTALPGGCRLSPNYGFWGLSGDGRWWTSTEYDQAAWFYTMFCTDVNVDRHFNGKRLWLSVRCVRD